VSALEKNLFSELNNWAWVYPCRYHTHGVITVSVRLRTSVSGYDFAIRLFHSQLQTGLSRRFPCVRSCWRRFSLTVG